MSKKSNGSRISERKPNDHPELKGDRRQRAIQSLENGKGASVAVGQLPTNGSAGPARLSQEMVPPENGADAGSPLVDDLMTIEVNVPGTSGEDPTPQTMRIQVPRQAGPIDASAVEAALAQSLQQLSQTVPSASSSQADPAPIRTETSPQPQDQGGRGGRGRNRAVPEEPEDDFFVPEEAPRIGRELSLRDIFFMVRERWVLGLSVGLLLAGGLAYWMMSKPPVYQAVAELLVELDEDKILPIESMDGEGKSNSTLEQAMEVHAKRLQTTAYRDYVLATLEHSVGATVDNEPLVLLKDFPTFVAFKKTYIDGLINLRARGKKDHSKIEMLPPEEMFHYHFYDSRAQSLSVTTGKRSPFIKVAFKHPDQRVAKQVTNAFVRGYNRFLSDRAKLNSRDASKFLEAQVEGLEKEIQIKERALQTFRQDNKIVETEEGEGSRATEKVETLDSKVNNAQIELVEMELQLQTIQGISPDDVVELSQVPALAEFGASGSAIGSVAAYKEKLDKNREERAQLELKYLSRHPKIIANNAERVSLTALLGANVKLAVQDFANRVAQKRKQQVELEAALTNAETDTLGDNNPIVQFKVMQSGLNILKDKYKLILDRLSETQIAERLERTKVDVMTPALLPDEPVDPDKKKVLALASLLLLGGLFGLPIGLGFIDTRLKSFSEAEAFLGIECLGCIPERPKLSAMELGQCVLAERDDQIMEGFRVVYGAADLHTHIGFPKAIVTSSTGPGEGKSFVTANLGATFARHGKRVIIIDGDLRKPSQHKIIGARNDAGILKWFRAGAHLPQTAKELLDDTNLGLVPLSEEYDIFLLRAGGSTRNPSEIITSKSFETLVNSLRNWFDVVMIDSPPVGLFPDTLFLANYAEEALFVCKHNGLNRHKIKFALHKMQDGPAQVLGTVMNQLSASKRHQYGYGYKDYGYGSYSDKEYANYYHAEEDED